MFLVPCPDCSRHIRRADPACPFCGRVRRVNSRALLAVAAASLCAAQCKPDAHRDQAAPAASRSASVELPAPSIAPSSDLGRVELGTAAVYGAPPPLASTRALPRGAVSIDLIAPGEGAPVNTERVVRSMIPGFRACYNRALQKDPEQAAKLQAKLRLTLRVAAGGEVASATVTPHNPELAAALSCMKARAMAALFEASGKATVITADVTLTPGG
jgi:hypothetical protein